MSDAVENKLLSLEEIKKITELMKPHEIRFATISCAKVFSVGMRFFFPKKNMESIERFEMICVEYIKLKKPITENPPELSLSDLVYEVLYTHWYELIYESLQSKVNKKNIESALFHNLNLFFSLKYFDDLDHHDLNWRDFSLKVIGDPIYISYSNFVKELMIMSRDNIDVNFLKFSESKFLNYWNGNFRRLF